VLALPHLLIPALTPLDEIRYTVCIPLQVHIIDFCKARRYCNAETGTHNPYRDNATSSGAFFFTSVNGHLGIERTRRDDLESVGYMLMYYLRGSLPWQVLSRAYDGQESCNSVSFC
jgi:hypothetical protein